MHVSVFKQLCLVAFGNNPKEVSSAVMMEASNAVQIALVLSAFVANSENVAVLVVLQQSNDLENWRTIVADEPIEIFECGSYMLGPYTQICTAAVRVLAYVNDNGHDAQVVLSVDVNLTRV